MRPNYKYLKKSDIRIADKIRLKGYKAVRDYDNVYIYNWVDSIRISKACYNRLVLEGLAEA